MILFCCRSFLVSRHSFARMGGCSNILFFKNFFNKIQQKVSPESLTEWRFVDIMIRGAVGAA